MEGSEDNIRLSYAFSGVLLSVFIKAFYSVGDIEFCSGCRSFVLTYLFYICITY